MNLGQDTKVKILMDRDSPRERLRNNPHLDLVNIDERAWSQILAECMAVDLRLYHLTVGSLDGIERLRNTVHLAIEWANKVEHLSPVFRMRWLQSLNISDFRLLRSIEGIDALQDLKELQLSGNLGSLHPPLRLNSIQPLVRLRNLEKLDLANVRLGDDDVTPIASISSLKDLAISHRFERKQLAFLAKRLNSQLKTPIRAYLEMRLQCSKCTAPLYLFVGRRMPMLCRRCETGRFDKLSLEFERLQQAS